jgi:outer membrane protein assembly factor BamB
MGQGSAEGVAPAYFSPADCGPIVCDGKVLVADRKYRLSIINVATGKLEKFINNVSAVALSADGGSVYARKLDGRLEKLDENGNVIWSIHCYLDDAPASPREVDGVVYVCSRRGLVSAVSADAGNMLWQYQATPQRYVYAAIPALGGTAYISATDGSLTALAR